MVYNTIWSKAFATSYYQRPLFVLFKTDLKIYFCLIKTVLKIN